MWIEIDDNTLLNISDVSEITLEEDHSNYDLQTKNFAFNFQRSFTYNLFIKFKDDKESVKSFYSEVEARNTYEAIKRKLISKKS